MEIPSISCKEKERKKERNREREENFPSDRESALLGKWLDPLSLFSRCYKNAFHYFYRLETKKEKRKREREEEYRKRRERERKRRYEEKFLCSLIRGRERRRRRRGERGDRATFRAARLRRDKGETYVYVRRPRWIIKSVRGQTNCNIELRDMCPDPRIHFTLRRRFTCIDRSPLLAFTFLCGPRIIISRPVFRRGVRSIHSLPLPSTSNQISAPLPSSSFRIILR